MNVNAIVICKLKFILHPPPPGLFSHLLQLPLVLLGSLDVEIHVAVDDAHRIARLQLSHLDLVLLLVVEHLESVSVGEGGEGAQGTLEHRLLVAHVGEKERGFRHELDVGAGRKGVARQSDRVA